MLAVVLILSCFYTFWPMANTNVGAAIYYIFLGLAAGLFEMFLASIIGVVFLRGFETVAAEEINIYRFSV